MIDIEPVSFIEHGQITFLEWDILMKNADFMQMREQLYAQMLGWA